ncbi:hypothetical protein HQQ81_13395 [Microbacteriaceae bacterium VKM Ac-2854]|nr:hypothetical protein [Microbacteriaceae bacterium VKM Ac-2854]
MNRAASPRDSDGIGDRFERLFVLAYAVGGVAFHLLAALEFGEEAERISPIWTAVVAVVVLPAPLITLIAALFASLIAVRTILRLHVVLFSIALLTLVPAVDLERGPLTMLWLIDAVPVALTAAGIALRPRSIPVAIATVCILLVLVRFVASGSLVTAAEEGIDMAIVGTLFAGLAQAVLRAGQALDRASQDAVLLSARTAGRLGRRSERIRVGALVHDEILSFLLNVDRISRSAESSREAARVALTHLAELRRTDPTGPTPSRARLTGGEFVRAATERIAAASPLAAIDARVESSAGPVPSAIADAFIDAAVQAARNAVQHARSPTGEPAAIRAAIVVSERGLTIEVGDDGAGFALAAVPVDRMGLSTSILGRVRQLAGATAQIAMESGTVVRLEWRR